MEFAWSVATYPARVAWQAAKKLTRPDWSNVQLVHTPTPPEWLEDFKQSCPPDLLTGFSPCVWAPDAHSQSIAAAVYNSEHSISLVREVLDMPDGEQVAMHWAVSPRTAKLPDDTPICVILHGLSGNGTEMKQAAAAATRHGMLAVCLSRRGHDPSLNLTKPKLLAFTDTCDLHAILMKLRDRYPKAPLVAQGSSAGSALLAGYASEHVYDNILTAMVCLSPGYYCQKLFSAHGGCVPWPYDYLLLRGLKRIVEKNATTLSGHVDMDSVRGAATITDYYTNVDVRIHDFDSLDEYWRVNEPIHPEFADATLPVLCISALDDPVVPASIIPVDEFRTNWNSGLLVLSDKGGHCGFLDGWTGESWANELSCTFLKFVADTRPNLSSSSAAGKK